MKKKFAAYLRVSTKGQEDNYSLPKQRRDAQKFGQDRNLDFDEFLDVDSGDDPTRPGLVKLTKALKAGVYELLWAGKTDRISRDVREGLDLLEILTKHSISLFIGKKEYDPSNPDDEHSLTNQWANAKLEKKQIHARTSPAYEEYLDSGTQIFPYVFGYDVSYNKSGNPEVSINTQEAKTVEWIYNSYIEGKSITEICRILNGSGVLTKRNGTILKKGERHKGKRIGLRWLDCTVGAILRHSLYLGLVKDSKKNLITSKSYPPILTSEVFEQVQQIRGFRQKKPHTNGIRKAGHLLSSLISCPICDGVYYFNQGPNFGRYLHKDGLRAGKPCPSRPKAVAQEPLDILISHIYLLLLSNPDDLNAYVESSRNVFELKITEIDKVIQDKTKEMEEVQQRIENLVLAIENGVLEQDEVGRRLQPLRQQKKNGIEEVENLRRNRRRIKEEESWNYPEIFQDELREFSSSQVERKREILLKRCSVKLVEDYKLEIRSSIDSRFLLDIRSLYSRWAQVEADYQPNIEFYNPTRWRLLAQMYIDRYCPNGATFTSSNQSEEGLEERQQSILESVTKQLNVPLNLAENGLQ